MKMKDEQRRPYFFVDGNGKLFQRSRVNPEQVWEVPQVADGSAAGDAHSDKHLPTVPGDKGKLECYSCHNSFAMNCLACHYQENFNQDARQQKEALLTGGLQGSHTNFQLFGMVRGPLILGVNGKAEQNRLSPMRSTMEAYVGLADCNGNSIANFVTHSNCRGGVPQAGTSMNNFMPHSVGTTARGCETCHSATN